MRFREQINQELAHITLPEDFVEKILSSSRKRTGLWRYQAACIVLCLLLAGGTVSAGWFVYSKIRVNDHILPESGPLEKKTVNASSTRPDHAGICRDRYDTYQELCSELGIELLYSDLADGNQYMQIQRKTDNVNWNEICITAFIVGDLREITKASGSDDYRWERGDEFSSPVDMEIDIVNSDSQLEHGWERDFLGFYEYVETYTSQQGYTVNLVKDRTVTEDEDRKVKPDCRAVFVADGIRYIVKGQVRLEKMKEIVDSLHY